MPSNRVSAPSAGSAEPYWFEWETGLLNLIEMLDEDSEIVSVGFQLHGTKGWDDVGVRLRNGTTRLIQIKHSRVDDTLTFGGLVNGQEGEASLLKTLAMAWKIERENRGSVECLLRTNRRAGPNWYLGSPPLDLFFEKLTAAANEINSIADIRWEGEDDRFPAAWLTFLGELDALDSVEKLEFIRALQVETDAPDLEELETIIKDRLLALTGLPLSSVQPLFNALLANVRIWASHTLRETEWIDRESLRASLVGEESSPRWKDHCQVETPDPFFPSRLDVVNILRKALAASSAEKVHFLSAEPGAGKTSCVSKLSRSGTALWKEQPVSIRFYAYRPIRPGAPEIERDFGEGVRPEALWIGLLWQIRDNLRKTRRLASLAVPVWLDGMPWQTARRHVLRLAGALGAEWGRPFVICIDGLDHAARARRAGLPEFIATLPSPEELPEHAKLLIGGQPAESYPEYPPFLRQNHRQVLRHSIGLLTDVDIGILWQSAARRLPPAHQEGAVQLLQRYGQGRTLPTVYAVEDIRNCGSLAEAASILASRPLPDSLGNYYDAIWNSASNSEGDMMRLAAVFSMLPERPTGALMAAAFSEIGRSATEWTDVMRKLRPLVRETPGGFELVHNDLRVHLSAILATQEFELRDAASALANHYRHSANRHAAHTSLPKLLCIAGRQGDFADDFTVEWVIEAGALGLDDERLADQCAMAFEGAVNRRDWLLLHAVACASLTVQRLHDCTKTWPTEEDPLAPRDTPLFLEFEGESRPLELWDAGTFSGIVSAAEDLVASGATTRAAAVLRQWIGDLPVERLVDGLLSALPQDDDIPRENPFGPELERLGRLYAICRLPLPSIDPDSDKHDSELEAMESGWVGGNAEIPVRPQALRDLLNAEPFFNQSWVRAIEEAAQRSRWGEVRAYMNRLSVLTEGVPPAVLIRFAWHAARSTPREQEKWLKILSVPNHGILPRGASLATLRTIACCLTYTNVAREYSQVAEELLPLLDVHNFTPAKKAAVSLIVRGSGLMGRMLRYADNNDFEGLVTAVPPQALKPYLSALWCHQPDFRNLPDGEFNTPSEVGSSLAEIAGHCGGAYRSLLVEITKQRFAVVISQREGRMAFNILRNAGERPFLISAVTSSARDFIDSLHEHDTSSRNGMASNLLLFCQELELFDLYDQIASRLKKTRLGYASHKEWVFEPLVRWFGVLRKTNPALWQTRGFQLISLDEISEQQGADNRYDSELVAEVATAAMQCGPGHFEGLFNHLVASTSKYPLANLRTAVSEGGANALSEKILTDNDSILSLAALATAVGRWPLESSVNTVEYFRERASGLPAGPIEAINIAAAIAAEMQGTAPPPELPDPQSSMVEPVTSSFTTLPNGLDAPIEGDLRLGDIAALVEKANVENTSDREVLVAKALEALEKASALNRCLDFHNIRTISKFTSNLSEAELWRWMAAITTITGSLRTALDMDPYWAFSVAFSAVDMTCRAMVEAGMDIGRQAFDQLLEAHWRWHGLPVPDLGIPLPVGTVGWRDAARRSLFALMETDACETLYMAMTGVRFFSEAFPDEIPVICSEGLAHVKSREAVVALAQMWATRYPTRLNPAAFTFAGLESEGTLDERLDVWVAMALRDLSLGTLVRNFELPTQEIAPEIRFPGDSKLPEVPSEKNGLKAHSAFSQMAVKRLKRASLIIGPTDKAFRKMVRTMRGNAAESPGFQLAPPQKLAWDGSYPRPNYYLEQIVGDAIMYQCSGQSWPPGNAGAVRLAMGFGMDPWIASSQPNLWPDKKAWPTEFETENWFEAGAPVTGEVAMKLHALRDGVDLDPAFIQLGAVLHVPTFRRDIMFFQWSVPPEAGQAAGDDTLPTVPHGKTWANWLGGWLPIDEDERSSVHFTGSLVNFPLGELELTPTSHWKRSWNWTPDPRNPLRFLSQADTPVARYERWHCSDGYSRKATRFPYLFRWVAHRDSFPAPFAELSNWVSKTTMKTGKLYTPE